MWCRHTRAGKEIYAHKRTYTYSHLYEGDERQHIHISGDSSPICKRHLESMLKGINVTQKYGVPQSNEQVWVRQSLRVVHTGNTSKMTICTTLLGKFLSMQAREQYLSWIFIFFCKKHSVTYKNLSSRNYTNLQVNNFTILMIFIPLYKKYIIMSLILFSQTNKKQEVNLLQLYICMYFRLWYPKASFSYMRQVGGHSFSEYFLHQ